MCYLFFVFCFFVIPVARGRSGTDRFITKFGKLGEKRMRTLTRHILHTPRTHPLTPTHSHTLRLTDVSLHEMYVVDDDADVMIAGIGLAGIVWMYHK